jgi:hypothetical protein
MPSVISVISVVKCIYIRLRLVTHTAGVGSFLALCRAMEFLAPARGACYGRDSKWRIVARITRDLELRNVLATVFCP